METPVWPGDFLVVEWSASNFTTSDGEVGLYFNDNNFGNPDNMADYMQYGTDGHEREDEADAAGVWEIGQFVELAPSGKTVSFFDTQGEIGEEDWEASNETQGTANDPIPVELTSFDAVVDARTVHLTWETASETNNAGFEGQHKRDGTFQQIGFVEGHGTTTVPQTYRLTAKDLAAGTHVFRLKQVDFDGAFEYSPVVEVPVAMETSHTLSSIYPNPARQNAQFTLAVRTSQPVTLALYDMLGRRVQTLYTGTLATGTVHSFAIHGQALAGGLYVVRATGTTFTSVRRVPLIE